jgi:hypothetical protein
LLSSSQNDDDDSEEEPIILPKPWETKNNSDLSMF